jgi:acetylornithine deacetylase/succinyl-diaminopimelate desuccinylase-like protein
VPLKRDLIFLATADEEAGSRFGAQWVADQRRAWIDGAEYALSELGAIHAGDASRRAPFGSIVISEKTGLPLRLTARSEPGHGSMPWPETAPHRLVRALGRLLDAERPLRVLPEIQEYFERMASVLPSGEGAGFDRLAESLGEPGFRARFLANRHHAALVRTTFAINMLKGSEKRNVIPPEAVADLDCRMLAGEDPEEIVGWVRGAIADPHVEVSLTGTAKVPNLSPPDTELYKSLADALRRRAPGAVVAPEIMVGFTDNWVFRRCGMHGYGFGPFVLEAEDWKRIHGNDERISVENLQAGARCYTEMLLDMAAA